MTCSFEIDPPLDKSFKVPKRIIGPRGKNMKKIIDACRKTFGKKASRMLKIRLRGRESGYLEGQLQLESLEPM